MGGQESAAERWQLRCDGVVHIPTTAAPAFHRVRIIERAGFLLKRGALEADEEPVIRRLIPAALPVPVWVLVGAISAVTAVEASAAPAPSATVNVCNSAGSPRTMGVRAQMPGRRAKDQLYVTIEPQWFSRRTQQWLPAGPGVEVHLGDGNVRSRQGGYTFEYEPPQNGRGHALRAAVGFQWRRGGDVVRSSSTVTSGGMAGALESDPPGYSAAVCLLR